MSGSGFGKPASSSTPTTTTLNARRFTSDFKQIVEIQCGEPPVKYQVHKYMLSTASSYFQAAFDGNFKEGQEGCLKLADEDSDTFDIILRAIYAEQLVHDKPAEEAHAVKKAIYAMIKVYIACDKYDLPAFKPPALDALTRYHDILRKKLGKGPCFGAIPLIYNNTTEASISREFITRRAASSCLRTGGKGHKEFAATILAGLPDFAADFVKTLVRAAGKTYDDPLTWPLEEPKPTEDPPTSEGNGTSS